MSCRRCGQCCNKALIVVDNCKLENPVYRDMARWYSYHHCQVKIDDRTGGMAIIIPLVCQHLEFDPASGTAICLIYDKRPQICRDYICEAAESKP